MLWYAIIALHKQAQANNMTLATTKEVRKVMRENGISEIWTNMYASDKTTGFRHVKCYKHLNATKQSKLIASHSRAISETGVVRKKSGNGLQTIRNVK